MSSKQNMVQVEQFVAQTKEIKLIIDHVFDTLHNGDVTYHIADHILPYIIEDKCEIMVCFLSTKFTNIMDHHQKCKKIMTKYTNSFIELNLHGQLLPGLEIICKDPIALAGIVLIDLSKFTLFFYCSKFFPNVIYCEFCLLFCFNCHFFLR